MKFKYFIVFFLGIALLYSCELESLLFDDDPRDKILGDWKVEEDSEIFKKNTAIRNYNVKLTKDMSDSTVVWVNGFYELSGNVKMMLNGRNIEIPNQTVDDYSIEDGSGSVAFDSKSMTLYYYVDIGTGDKDVVRADYKRE